MIKNLIINILIFLKKKQIKNDAIEISFLLLNFWFSQHEFTITTYLY